jgi:hypothetical protein
MKASLLSTTTPPPSVQDLSKSGNGSRNGNGRHHHYHPRFRNGYRLAARRAYAAARLVLDKGLTAIDAADWCGSNPAYVGAMVTVIKSQDEFLLAAVLAGYVPVLTAAAQVKGLAKLVAAYTTAAAETKAAFGRTIGTENVFDEVIAPAIAAAE